MIEPSDFCAEVAVHDLTVTFDDETEPQGTPMQMTFKGWTVVPDTCQTPEEIKAYTESPNVPVIHTDTILISRTTRLYPVFEPICWLDFNTNQNKPGNDAIHYSGATYKPPLYFKSRDGFDFNEETPTTPKQTPPELAGYEFDGWFTGNGVRVTNADLTLPDDLSTDVLEVRDGRLFFREQTPRTVQVDLYAHWLPSQTTYTIVIWQQKVTDAPNLSEDEKSYDFYRSFSLDALTGSDVSVADDYKNPNSSVLHDPEKPDDFKGFTFEKADGTKTARGDGKTILNVYYQRNKHTFTFRNNNRIIHTVSALYGADISGIWHFKGSDNINYPINANTSWQPNSQSGYTARITQMLRMPDTDITFTYTVKNYTKRTFHYYVEALPGTNNTTDYGNMQFVPYNESLQTVEHDFNQINYNADFLELEGFSRDVIVAANGADVTNTIWNNGSGNNVSWNDSWNSDLSFYYTRNTYTLTAFNTQNYMHPQYMDVDILFEDTLQNHIPDPPEAPEGLEFTGWYADEACSTPIAFTEAEAEQFQNSGQNYQAYFTMPANNLAIYAGWQTKWFKIEIDPNGGVLTGTQATWFWEPYKGDPIEEYKTVTRCYEPDENGDYYYALRNRAYYGLGEKWVPEEDTTYKNQIVDGLCTRGAFYTSDISLATSTIRYKEAKGAYRYLGWVEVNPVTGEETPFNFGTHVFKNTWLRLLWKQLDTYLISYHAGEGRIDTLDSNEQTFEFLDADNYADHAEVVVTRVAIAPPGKNFTGWQIQNDDSQTVYYPGQSFQFDSRFADRIVELDADGNYVTKRVITLNAVYREIGNARIIYDPNGGTIDSSALEHCGGQDSGREPQIITDGTDYPLTAVSELKDNRLIVSDLMNNSAVRLADGIGFTNDGYQFVGWSTTPDGQNGSFYRADSIRCYADNEEPLILYAQWEMRVYFDRNNVNSPDNSTGWGGDWTESGYKKSVRDGMYYTTVRLGTPIIQPVYIPVSSLSEEMFRHWSIERQTTVGVMKLPFDFSTPITQEFADEHGVVYSDSDGTSGKKLTLYGCWDAPIHIPVHIVDTTDALWVKHDDWLKNGVTSITLGNENIALASEADAAVYADAAKTAGKIFAFACTAGNGDEDYRNVSEEQSILAIRYDTADRMVKVQSANHTWRVLDTGDTTPEAVWLVYYAADRDIPISYMKYGKDRSLTPVTPLQDAAPVQAHVTNAAWKMQEYVTAPMAWATSSSYHPNFYTFALGETGADHASGLQTITAYSQQDTDRPVLNIRNSWKGLEYTLDGQSWQLCGYDKELYVLYYEEQPVIVNLTEHTIGLPEDITETFNYSIVVKNCETTRVIKTYYCYHRSTGKYSEITDSEAFAPTVTITGVTEDTVSRQNATLSDGQNRSFVLLYGIPEELNAGGFVNANQTYNSRQVYYKNITQKQTIQKIEITQAEKTDFSTTNDAAEGNGKYESSYQAAENAQPYTITYTNRHLLEKHIHLAVARNGTLTHQRTLRTTDAGIYSHIFGNTWDLTAIDPATFIQDPEGRYGFAGIITGSVQGNIDQDNGGIVTPSEQMPAIESLSFDETGGGKYGYYLNGDRTKLLGTQEIFLVYFERPVIRYMYRDLRTGELLAIDPLNKNGSAFLREGTSITQGELIPVTANSELCVSQISTPGNPAFLIPDLLDQGDKQSLLDLTEIGIPRDDGTLETYRKETVQLSFADNALQYRFDASDTLKSFGGELAVYAIYRIRGYTLTLSKSVTGDAAGGPASYQFRIASDTISDGSYYISGYGDAETVMASGHSIVLTLQSGDRVTIYGLLQGDYTITEETICGAAMAATINGRNAAVSGKRVAVHIQSDTDIHITNIYPIPVTDAQDHAAPYQMLVLFAVADIVIIMILRKGRWKAYQTNTDRF